MYVELYWSHSFIADLVRSDGVVFDLGVNDGGFSRLLAPRCRSVIGFEPDPAWTTTLKLPPNVTLVPNAIAARPGPLSFHVNPGLCASMHYREAGSRTIEVTAITLEEALAAAPAGRIDLLKMDIEGEEVDVLLQAPAHLFARIAQMTVEFHDFLDRAQVPRIEAAIARMRELGFHAVCFSFRSYGDMLFVNQTLAPLSVWQRLWLLVRFKYCRGLGRWLRRWSRA